MFSRALPSRLRVFISRKFCGKRSGDSGITQYFTMIGRQLEILDWPTETPDDWGSFTLELIYYGTESIVEMATWDTPTNPNSDFESPGTPPITEIRGDNATSRLLQVAPDAYLYGSLVPAFRYLRDLQKAQEADAEFLRTMGEIQMEYADADLTGSPLTIASIYDEGGRY